MVKKGGRKQKNTPKIGKRQWITGGAIIALSTLLLVFLSWFFYTGSTKEIVVVADQFKPDSSWELVSENIQPPATVCIDVECPSISRRWKTSSTLDKSSFTKVLHSSGWIFQIEGSCKLETINYYSNNIEVCSATGTVNKYKIIVTVGSSNPYSNSWIGLSVREIGR